MKSFKSMLSVLLAVMMVFSCFVAFADDADTASAEETEATEIVTTFSDVDPNSTVGKAVKELAMRGVINGYPDGTYLPDGNITRAEFSAVCVRLANLSNGLPADAVTGFSDLDNDDSYKWARPYVQMAKGRGIINGYEDGTFKAGNPVTYEEAVKMLMCLLGWGPTCEAQTKLVEGARWSYGYIKMANQEGLTKSTNSSDAVISQPTTRGTVAILANNARDVSPLETTYENGKEVVERQSSGSNTLADGKYTKTVSGIVTGTYLTKFETPEDEDEDYSLKRYEIMVDDVIYDVNKATLDKLDIYDLLGKKVKMTYNTKDDEVTVIDVTDYNATEIYSAYAGEKKNFLVEVEGGKLKYTNDPETFKLRETSLSGNIIYNGKLVDDFSEGDLIDPDSPYFFKNGVIEVIENGKYDIVKISNYDDYVVSGIKSASDEITLYYRNSKERTMPLPESNDSDYFVFRRGSTDIDSVSQLAKFDVLSVLKSPESADGTSIMIVDVTRSSKVSQKVTAINENDSSIYEIGGDYYQYDYEYDIYDPDEDGNTDDKPTLKKGDEGVSIYLNNMGQIAAVATSSSSSSPTSYNYGYLLNMVQNDDDREYDLMFYIMNQSGAKKEYGTSKNVEIDGNSYKNTNKIVETLLENSAEQANEAYLSKQGDSVTNLTCQQPIRFKLNSSGLVTAIDTVVEDDDEDALVCEVPYSGERRYTTSSGFNSTDEDQKFGVGSGTKIFYIPDNRTDFDEYALKTTSTFSNGNDYHVEAYNRATGSQKKADMVLLFKTNDSIEFNYKSPFLIVSGMDWDEDDNRTVTGYDCAYNKISTSANKTLSVNERKLSAEGRAALENMEKGDIVRYLVDSDGKIIDLQLWLDVSDPAQDEPVSSVSEALSSRILAIKSDGTSVNGDAYNASFRLAYGTVLVHDDEDKILTVSPTLPGDADEGLDMATGGTGVVAHKYSTSTKVFYYDSRKGAQLMEDGFSDLLSYDDAGDAASVVVTFTTGDTTSSSGPFRFIYIIK